MVESLFELSESKLIRIRRLKRVISRRILEGERRGLLSQISITSEKQDALVRGFLKKMKSLYIYEILLDQHKIFGATLSIARKLENRKKGILKGDFNIINTELFHELYILAEEFNHNQNMGGALVAKYRDFISKEFGLNQIIDLCKKLINILQNVSASISDGRIRQADSQIEKEIGYSKNLDEWMKVFPEIEKKSESIKAASLRSLEILQNIRNAA
jgi:hypothetical protein